MFRCICRSRNICGSLLRSRGERFRSILQNSCMNLCRFTAAFTAAGSSRTNAYQEIREKFPLVHGANLRYLCSLMEQELPRGKGMILVSPEYANYASVMEMLRTGSKYPLLHARADGNEEAEEVERREIFLGLLE